MDGLVSRAPSGARSPGATIASLSFTLLLSACPDRPVPQVEVGPPDGGLDARSDGHVADRGISDGPLGDGRCRVFTVSVSSSGQAANAAGIWPSISRDGKSVAFSSGATNLHPGVSSGVYVRDLLKKTTTLVSVDNKGAPAVGGAFGPTSISADGRSVAFRSAAANLVSGVSSGFEQLFYRDRVAGVTEILSVSSAGSLAETGADGLLSGDGGWAAMASYSAKLVPNDTNGKRDIFLRNLAGKATVRVSVAHDGSQCNVDGGYPSISHDGSRVAFTSGCLLVPAPTPPQNWGMVYVYDQSGKLTLVTTSLKWGTSEGRQPVISGDGTVVVYLTRRDPVTDLTMPKYNLYLFDLTTKQHARLTKSSSGGEPDNDIVLPAISPNGRYVSFSSMARNLVPGDKPGWFDAYLLDRQTGTTTMVSVDRQGHRLNAQQGSMLGHPNYTSVADDGSVAFSASVEDCDTHATSGPCVYVYQGCD